MILMMDGIDGLYIREERSKTVRPDSIFHFLLDDTTERHTESFFSIKPSSSSFESIHDVDVIRIFFISCIMVP